MDLVIWGCPVNKYMVVEVIAALLQNRRPNFPPSPVCLECKRSGTVCVVVAQGIPCLGPVVHGGCGALCPANGRGCYGCFGPSSVANFSALVEGMVPRDRYPNETAGLLRSFSSHAPAFRNAAEQAFKLAAKRRTNEDHRSSRPGTRRRRRRPVYRLEGRQGRRDPPGYLRTAALLRRLPGRAFPAGSARHHRPHLRHLPGGLPDELGHRPGECPGRAKSARRSMPCAA